MTTLTATRPLSMTTPTVQTAAESGSLSSRAILIDLTLRSWTAARRDSDASQTVAAAHGNRADMGSYRKMLVPKAYIEPIRKLMQAAYQFHMDRTLPWLSSGARIIAAEGYPAYAAGMRKFESDLQPLVDSLVADWDSILAEAQSALNGLFKAAEYPSKGELRGKYSIGWNVVPVPDSRDFRVDLGVHELARVQRQLDEANQAALAAARSEIAARIRETVGHMAERLRAYTVTAEGVSGAFRDSLVENVRDLVNFIPSLNVMGDQGLSDLAARMNAELAAYDPQALRDSEDKRNEVAAAAESILGIMDSFIA
jgi:hypothetical protein